MTDIEGTAIRAIDDDHELVFEAENRYGVRFYRVRNGTTVTHTVTGCPAWASDTADRAYMISGCAERLRSLDDVVTFLRDRIAEDTARRERVAELDRYYGPAR